MQSVTFRRIAPDESRIYHDSDLVGEVYRQADCLKPGSHDYVIHLDEDCRGPVRSGARAFAHPRSGHPTCPHPSAVGLTVASAAIARRREGRGGMHGRFRATPSGRALRCNLRFAPISAAIHVASARYRSLRAPLAGKAGTVITTTPPT